MKSKKQYCEAAGCPNEATDIATWDNAGNGAWLCPDHGGCNRADLPLTPERRVEKQAKYMRYRDTLMGEDNTVAPELTDEQLKAEIARRYGCRDFFKHTGYKLLWQTETTNHNGDRAVISSWIGIEVPPESPKGYKMSIHEDVLLIERYNGADGERCGASIYTHGAARSLNGRVLPNEEEEEVRWDEIERAAEAVENE